MIAVAGRLIADPARADGVAGLAGRIAVAAAARGSQVELIARAGDDPAGDTLLLALARAGVGHAALLRDPARPTPVAGPRAGAAGTPAATAGPGTAASPGAAAGDEAEPRPAGGGAAPADRDDWAGALDEDEPATGAPPRDPGATVTGLELQTGDLELALRYLADVSVVVLADPASPGLVAVAADGAAFSGAALVVVGEAGWEGAGQLPANATILVAPAGDPDGGFATLVADYAVALDGGHSSAEAWAAATGRLGAERV